MASLTIGEAANEAGVSVETIRFYERRGLIQQPPKPPQSIRRYSERLVAQVRFLKEAQKLGFSLREAKDLLDVWEHSGDCSEIHARARAKRSEIHGKIDTLLVVQAALDELIAGCPKQGDLRECPIIDALADRVV